MILWTKTTRLELRDLKDSYLLSILWNTHFTKLRIILVSGFQSLFKRIYSTNKSFISTNTILWNDGGP